MVELRAGRVIVVTVVLLVVCGLALVAGPESTRAAQGRGPVTCPHAAPTGIAPAHNAWPAAKRTLAPAPVAAVRLCRYSTRLLGSALLAPSDISAVMHDFAALRATPRNYKGAASVCPFNTDPVVAHLEYATGHAVTIYVPISCPYAANGDLTRGYPTAALHRLTAVLVRLTPR
jgi:hypothetical protein